MKQFCDVRENFGARTIQRSEFTIQFKLQVSKIKLLMRSTIYNSSSTFASKYFKRPNVDKESFIICEVIRFKGISFFIRTHKFKPYFSKSVQRKIDHFPSCQVVRIQRSAHDYDD